ncbi:HNH endonuclease [Colwellia psychrerythraea]|uniref:HNH nuclease n=1 Tax=Colwellia psychrerythraea TaxID=28229 RepID=A0A099L6Y9_COLPS|nr:HNH endonuclease [Colwellia psychrerythraea]KGJ97947.1 HNH nuclease [Colwellia psychrerythraea]
MRLTVDLSSLQQAVKAMGAERIDFELSSELTPIEPIDTQLGEGLEVNLEEIEFETGLASYQGRQVLLYIRDHGGRVSTALNDGSKGNKYHIADCGTLAEMRAKGRFDRYVVTNKLSGQFHISGDDWETNQHTEGEANLKVCKNCLAHLNYQGYKNKVRGPIFNAFDLTDFFDTYSSFFKFMPSGAANKNIGYSKDWDVLSRKTREKFNYQCQQCALDLNQHKRLLHVHHINGVKSDNSSSNLTPLCCDCHRKQPLHQHMFIKHEDSKRISQLRRSQGLNINKSWQDVYDHADPGMHGVIGLLEKYYVSLPEVGEDIKNNKQYTVAGLELAWPLKKVGIAIDKPEAIAATKQGWKIYSMRHALSQIEQLVSSLR